MNIKLYDIQNGEKIPLFNPHVQFDIRCLSWVNKYADEIYADVEDAAYGYLKVLKKHANVDISGYRKTVKNILNEYKYDHQVYVLGQNKSDVVTGNVPLVFDSPLLAMIFRLMNVLQSKIFTRDCFDSFTSYAFDHHYELNDDIKESEKHTLLFEMQPMIYDMKDSQSGK